MRLTLRAAALCLICALSASVPAIAQKSGGGVAGVPKGALGLWKLNAVKSTLGGPAPKNQTAHNQPAPNGGMKITNDSIDATGKTNHSEIVVMFDGKEYELKGAASPTTRAYTRIDDYHYEYVTRVNGKIINTSRVAVAPDGKSRTIVATGVGTDGRPVKNITVWDRQ
jgi:hypothetical protein